jgi:hypothetical protein
MLKKKKKKTTFRNWENNPILPATSVINHIPSVRKKANNQKQQALQRKKLAANYNDEKSKNRNCKLCTYISSSFCTYLLQLHYSYFFLFLLLLFFPTMKKTKPKRKQRTRRNYERKGSTQKLTKHGT